MNINIIKYLDSCKRVFLASDALIEIHVLTSHSHLLMCLASLMSFVKKCKNEFKVMIHDDGTLTENDYQLIDKYFSGINIIYSSHADEVVLKRLFKYKASLRFRREKVFAKKLFDFYFFAENKKILLLDSDVLFFKYPKEIMNWFLSNNEYITYNWDPNDYSQKYLKKIKHDLGYNYTSGLNIGLFCVYKKTFDLELINNYLEYFYRNNAIEWVTEQNCFNLLSTRMRCVSLPREKYFFQNKRNVFYKNRSIKNFSKKIVAKHYSRYARCYFITEGIKYLYEEEKKYDSFC